jgi:hypothetical protein
MLSDIHDTIATMPQERDEFHATITEKFDLIKRQHDEQYLDQKVQQIFHREQQEKYDRLTRSYASLKERNKVLTNGNRVLEELNTEAEGRLAMSEYETYEARRDLRLYQRQVEDETHGHKISINCALTLDHYDFIGYTSGTCEGCEFKRKKWVILNEKRFEEIQIRNEICTKKEKVHDKVVLQLRQLNVSITQRLKEMRTNHSKSKTGFERRIKTLKTEVNMSTRRLNEFKANFKTRLDESITQTEDLTHTKNLELLIESFQTHTDDIRTLKQYAVLERFIRDTCYERTGVKRDYRAYPPVYNNIYDLVELKGIESFLIEAFGLTVAEFCEVFTALKNDRIGIAHPTVGRIDIETVQQIVKQRQ